jgi:hypothetical protein
MGVSFIGRYFSSGQQPPSAKSSESALGSESQVFLPARSSRARNFVPDLEDLDIALPEFIGSEPNSSKSMMRSGSPYSSVLSRSGLGQRASASSTASLFSKSFNQFFSSVFNQNEVVEAAANSKEEFANPFTEARQKQELSADSAETKTEVAEKSARPEKEPAQESKQQTKDAATASSETGISLAPAGKPFLIIGDFDGSGILRTLAASRSGDAAFISDDGERGFNLYVNTDAVHQQRSFYIDDINRDGITDLLVTSRAQLFGAVLLGDGNGGYNVADKFVTGYEPIIPCAGPDRAGKLEILTVNTRTGILTTFVSSDRYRMVQTEDLAFLPNYLLHLVSPGTSREFLMAAQIGGIQRILGWGEDNILRPTAEALGANPMVLSGTFGSGNLQGYQVGSYASLVLSSQGNSFNVANLRTLPQTFIVLGDFYNQGSIDVAVGSLLHFTPKK